MKRPGLRHLLSLLSLLALGVAAQAAPGLNSRPGAAYTLYLNFDGFSYTGTWFGSTPGVTAAYPGSVANIQETWARTAEQYAAFDVNVTTVDPAIAAGQAGSFSQRQTYYDNTARLMHTVIGGDGAWFGGGGGVSFVGTTPNATSGGGHTNWVFSSNLGPNGAKFVADATVHENGHGLGLSHQGDNLTNTGQSNEYSQNGFTPVAPGGNGSYSPNMGAGYYTQRTLWRRGTVSTGTTVQNDVQVIRNVSGMTYVDDGIGNSFAAATTIPLTTGGVIHSVSSNAKGVITPASATPTALGINNYTKNYYSFSLGAASTISLTASSGRDWVTPGTLAPGGALRPKLNIYGASDLVTPVGLGVDAANTLSTTYSGNLAAGTYFVEITSTANGTSTFDPTAQYFDMGSYLLSGSGFSSFVPEPGSFALLLLGAPVLYGLRRGRRRSS